ncbi:fructosamine kinase family protein [Cyanobium sp. CH-040]|uniref:fructosamine kinase family protein n=1 Tax=Cyanobium sp. CH-040 TaxID=2823708 RepID=UPI0020CBCD5E|nr:fructosamine kinase family protein [Cyanobium sp. CH-040]MCP9928508.1 fructosamine kinase family protein [Cyanobium sp. CH-040]
MSDLPQALLASWLAERLEVTLTQLAPVGGGCIHQAWRADLADGRRLFVKTNRAEALPLLEAEAAGLRALGVWARPPLRVPEPLAVGVAGTLAVLVLPWLDLHSGGGGRAQDWRELGRGLAELHRRSRGGSAGRYGFETDNFIGSTPQPNTWHSDWAGFFIDCRIAPQLRLGAAAGRHLRGVEQLLAALPAWLGAHRCEPVLVHGDLWSGNAGLLTPGSGAALFDPASHWADREVDLAMAGLFGGFPAAFFQGYEDTWPLPPGADVRAQLYNLYHLLNHAHLFDGGCGGGYWRQAQASLDRLQARFSPGSRA